jgi:hypothetical protein
VNERTKEACAQIKEKIKIVSESKGGKKRIMYINEGKELKG